MNSWSTEGLHEPRFLAGRSRGSKRLGRPNCKILSVFCLNDFLTSFRAHRDRAQATSTLETGARDMGQGAGWHVTTSGHLGLVSALVGLETSSI